MADPTGDQVHIPSSVCFLGVIRIDPGECGISISNLQADNVLIQNVSDSRHRLQAFLGAGARHVATCCQSAAIFVQTVDFRVPVLLRLDRNII
jgi:hypothetical protein